MISLLLVRIQLFLSLTRFLVGSKGSSIETLGVYSLFGVIFLSFVHEVEVVAV